MHDMDMTYRSEMKKAIQASKQMKEMLQPMYVMKSSGSTGCRERGDGGPQI